MARRRRRQRRTDRGLRERRERKYRLRGGKGRTRRFIPDADREFAQMARHFAEHVEAHAERFGFAEERVEELTSAVAAFREALCRTMQRDHAGPKATAVKNSARKAAERVIRAAGRHLRGAAEETLTSVDRMILNIRERPKRQKELVCPQVAPVLMFKGSTDPQGTCAHGARHILEFGNDFDRGSSAKPHGAARLELFVELVPVGEPIPSHPAERSGGRLWFLRAYTSSRFEVEFPVMDDGTPMLVCYWGRWADTPGRFGPFSQTCVARVESCAGMPMYALPGAPRRAHLVKNPGAHPGAGEYPGAGAERIRVTQVVGQLEGRVVTMSAGALPHRVGSVAGALPEKRAGGVEAGVGAFADAME